MKPYTITARNYVRVSTLIEEIATGHSDPIARLIPVRFEKRSKLLTGET